MLTRDDAAIARELKRRIEEITEVSKLVVYGSRARGDATPESDMDVYIEVPVLTPELRWRISEAAWEVGFDSGIVISTFVTTPKDVQEGPIGANPLLIAVQREGISL